MKFTQVAPDAFKQLQLNAGVLLTDFSVTTKTVDTSTIIGATSGGVSFSTNPEYTDFGEDIDNVPANTKQLKRLTSMDPTMSGTFKTVTAALAKDLIAAADVNAASGLSTVTPRKDLTTADFKTIWWVGDYSDVNSDGTSTSAGFVAIKMDNALNTSGFSIQSNDDGKGDFSFEYHAHYDIDDIDAVPFAVYVYSSES